MSTAVQVTPAQANVRCTRENLYGSNVQPGVILQTSTMTSTPSSTWESSSNSASNPASVVDMVNGIPIPAGAQAVYKASIAGSRQSFSRDGDSVSPYSVGVPERDKYVQQLKIDAVVKDTFRPASAPVAAPVAIGPDPNFSFVFETPNRGQQDPSFGYTPEFNLFAGMDTSASLSTSVADLGTFDTTGFGFDTSSFSFDVADFSNLFEMQGGSGSG